MSGTPDIDDQLNKTIEQINTYIENSAEQLNCGPDCQALEATQTLKEKYEQAKKAFGDYYSIKYPQNKIKVKPSKEYTMMADLTERFEEYGD